MELNTKVIPTSEGRLIEIQEGVLKLPPEPPQVYVKAYKRGNPKKFNRTTAKQVQK